MWIQTHKANYTPVDPDMYYAMSDVDLKVTVSEPPIINSDENMQAAPLRAWIRDGLLYVSGLTPGKTLSVYTATGALEYQSIVASSETSVKLLAQGMYIVHSGGKTVKVVFE